MNTVHNEIQAVATIESLKNPIDAYAVLDRQIKDLQAKADVLKDQFKSTLKPGKHRGEFYGVTVSEKIRTGSVDVKALAAAFNITDEQFAKFRAEPTIYLEVKAVA